MADPLSFVASITAVASLAGTVATKGYRYLKAVKNCSEDVRTLMVEVNVLCGILDRLVVLLRTNGSNPRIRPTPSNRPCRDSEAKHENDSEFTDTSESEDEAEVSDRAFKPPAFIYECQKILSEIEGILNSFGRIRTESSDSTSNNSRFSLSRLRRLDAKDLKWPLSRSRTLQLVEALERHKSTCIVALAKDSLASVHATLEQTKISNRHLTELKAKQEKMLEICTTHEEGKALRWLSPADPAVKLQAFRRDRQSGTGRWLFDLPEMSQWLDNSNEALWIYGIPGAGKTILSTLVVDEVLYRKRSKSVGTAYFYIRYDDSESHKPWNVLGSLIAQLARQNSTALAIVMEIFTQTTANGSSATRLDGDDLDQLLYRVLQSFQCIYIMIDGLDECGLVFDSCRKRLINIVSGLHRIRVTSVHTLVFSRDEHDIRKQLSATGFRSVSIAATSSDLRLFTNAWLPSLEIQSEKLKMEIVDSLVEQANGMFMWVRAQIDYLQRLPSDIEKRRALGHLPPDLPQTYVRILETIDSTYPVQTTKYIRRLLEWLVLSVENSKAYQFFTSNKGTKHTEIATLCQVICIENERDWPLDETFPTPEHVFRWLGCLINKIGDEGRVQLSHFTIREFLTMDQKEISSSNIHKYLVNPSNNEFSSLCFRYLTHDKFRNMVLHNREQVRSFLRENTLYENVASQVYNILYLLDDEYKDHELDRLLQKFLSSTPNTLFDLWTACVVHIVVDDQDTFYTKDKEKKKYDTIARELNSPLILASFAGLASHVDRLLKEGVNPNLPKPTPAVGLTPLHFAILEGSVSFADALGGSLLINFMWNTDPDRHRSRGLRVSKLLLASNANVEQQLEMEIVENVCVSAILTPLTLAIFCDKHEVASLLLNSGADWNATANLNHEGVRDLCSVRNLLMLIPLLKSTVQRVVEKSGHRGLKETLEQWRKSEEIAGESSPQTLFVEAYQSRDWEGVGKLLETFSNIDVNYIDAQRESALCFASLGPETTLRCLLEHGADPNAPLPSGSSPLCRATLQGYTENMKLLLEFGANIEIQEPGGWTPLLQAASYRQYDAVQLLLDSGADVNATLNDGTNALSVHGVMEDEAMFTMLLARGIDLNTPNNYGRLPLHLACKLGLESQSDRLISLATNAFDSINQNHIIFGTPLYIAAGRGFNDIVDLLLDRGALIDKTGPGNVLGSALMAACAHGHTEAVKLLLSRGASLEIEESRFLTAEGTARAFRQDAVVKILEEHSRGDRLKAHSQQSDDVHSQSSIDADGEHDLPDEVMTKRDGVFHSGCFMMHIDR